MSKNTIIAVNIALLFLIIGGFIFWKTTQTTPIANTPISENNQNQTQSENTTQNELKFPIVSTGETASSTQVESTDKLKINTINGGYITVEDFYKNPYTQVFDPQNDAVIKESDNYTITYYAKFQSFNIALTGGDLHFVRTEAENALLEKLGISKEEACQLTVSLGVPYFANAKASGTEYGLSFCPNSVPLPKNL